MRVIIDAYNVIRTNPAGKLIEEKQGNRCARDWLQNLCRSAVRDGEEWILVFDGNGTTAAEPVNRGSLVVRYSHPLTADEVIRELGEDALALSIPARIVSSDSEVQVPGCEQQDSPSFLEFVIRRKNKPPKTKTPSKAELADRIIKTLLEKGAVAAGTPISYQVKDGLVQLISYLYSRRQNPQKMAREIEEYLRARLPMKPNPDPQKEIFRTIKQILESPVA